jgi:flagellar biosynthesis protein FliR
VNAAALLVFARSAGFASRAPGFSHPSVPAAVRIGLAVSLSVAIAPAARGREPDGVALMVALVTEFLIGTSIGLGASVLYDGAYAGGRILDDYVGVKAIAPSIALVAPSGFGRIWSSAFTGAFFLLGAYRTTVLAFAQSFVLFPVGATIDPHGWAAFAASLATTIVVVAAGVAAPAIALAFVVQIALAALTRTIPRFSSFALSLPLVFGAVLVVTAVSLPLLVMRSAVPIVLFPGHGP